MADLMQNAIHKAIDMTPSDPTARAARSKEKGEKEKEYNRLISKILVSKLPQRL